MIPIELEQSSPLCRLKICNGRICGDVTSVPREYLEERWIEEGLHSTIAMKICGCQDACELASVARIITPCGTEWYENLQREHYDALLEWALECQKEEVLVPRPKVLQKRRYKGRIKDKS